MIHRSLGRRRRLTLLFATALVALGVTAGSASAATTTFSNSANINIPDTDPAVPYPSTITASGLAGNVQKATVTLNGFSHTCPDDIAVLLVGPSGTNSILMGRVGGCPPAAPPVNLTFDQAATSSLNDADYPASGTYKPSEAFPTPDLAAPAPAGPYPVDLNLFNGGPANGLWQLFIEDQVGGDDGTISGGWSLTLNAPVNTIRAGKPKLNKKKGTAQVPVTVADAGNLTLRGKGVKSASASKAKAVAGPGTVKLTVRPKGKTKKKLNSTGKAAVKVKITFTPTGGTPNTQTKKIKLKKTL
jgi:subtilisin-like proprotein convertase family protein